MQQSILIKGIRVIEALSLKGPQSTDEICHVLGISKSSTYRVLTTLLSTGYVLRQKEASKDMWKMDLKFLSLSSNILSRLDLKSAIRDILVALADETQEIAQIAVLHDSKVMIIDVAQQHRSLISVSPAGELLDINSCAGGLVLCAYLSEDKLDHVLNEVGELPRHTLHTITDKQEFRELLKEVKDKGHAVDQEYFAVGHICIAAPIWDYKNEVIAAINISGHIKTITPEKIDIFTNLVQKAAVKASNRLGHQREEHALNGAKAT